MSTLGEPAASRTCARPGCSERVVEVGRQGTPRQHCGDSCRTLHYQHREALALEDPGYQVRRAAEKALHPLDTHLVNDALPGVPADVRQQFEKVRVVLREICERLPDPEQSDGLDT